MAETPSVTIIVPSTTGRTDTVSALLAQQSLQGWELVVVPGVSPPARARNVGARQAQGRILIFLDDDIRLGDDRLLADLSDALQQQPKPTAVGVAWRPPPEASTLQRWLVRDRWDPQVIPVSPRLGRMAWHSLGASCFAIRREVFEAVGGFDEGLVSGEDHELWCRFCAQGGRLLVLMDRWIFHEPPRTLLAAVRKAIWYELGNAQVARKHPEAGYRIRLKSRWHAAGYLLLRTVALAPLMFLKMSYRHRRPVLTFRPIATVLSYIGAWAYCWSWFAR